MGGLGGSVGRFGWTAISDSHVLCFGWEGLCAVNEVLRGDVNSCLVHLEAKFVLSLGILVPFVSNPAFEARHLAIKAISVLVLGLFREII